MNDENIVYQARLHWIIFVWPVTLLVLLIIIGVKFELVRQPSLLIGGVILLWLLTLIGMYRFCSLTIKTTHIILRKGFFSRQTLDIPLNRIESIDIRQSLLGTIFGYGNLELTGTGGSRELVVNINKPLVCRRHIEQLLHG